MVDVCREGWYTGTSHIYCYRHLFVYVFVCLSICLSVCLSVCLSAELRNCGIPQIAILKLFAENCSCGVPHPNFYATRHFFLEFTAPKFFP